jgi:hypothetical protein
MTKDLLSAFSRRCERTPATGFAYSSVPIEDEHIRGSIDTQSYKAQLGH